ncbi:MAG: phosphodiester glycosidase family protein, partial [bacterium]|nr:phosphodiester glycosidase family protein [bacterium]
KYLIGIFFFLSLSFAYGVHYEISFPVSDGVYYHHLQTDTTGVLLNVCLVSIDLNNPNISISIATAHSGLERTTLMAKRNQAMAGINGGFFSFNPKVPVGLVMTEGNLIAPPLSDKPARAAVGITSTHRAVFDRVALKESKLIGMNTTDWTEVTEALGGVSMLVRNGQPAVTVLDEGSGISFSTTTHPRTCVGVTKDNKLLLVTIDGRQPEISNGISLDNLANLMMQLGAVNAMNLDGGGSTTMVIFDTIVNFPSDKDSYGNSGRERAVANGILIKTNPNTEIRNNKTKNNNQK